MIYYVNAGMSDYVMILLYREVLGKPYAKCCFDNIREIIRILTYIIYTYIYKHLICSK